MAWDIHQFQQVSRGYWNELPNQRKFMDEIATKLNINSPEDWSKVTTTTIDAHGGSRVLSKYDDSLVKGIF